MLLRLSPPTWTSPGPGHKPVKGTLPPDLATCVTILDAARLPEPTLWVFSGGATTRGGCWKTPLT